MAGSRWGHRLRRVPLLGGVVAALSMVRDIYDVIGWTDPGYHSIRSGKERLDEARRVAAIGDSADVRGGTGTGGEASPAPPAGQQDHQRSDAASGQE